MVGIYGENTVRKYSDKHTNHFLKKKRETNDWSI